MSYEQRVDQINKAGLKINYPKLKFLYKENIQENMSQFQKKESLNKQFEQLIALELANIKMRGQKLIYLDIVKVSLTEL